MTLISKRTGQAGFAELRQALAERFPWPDRLLDGAHEVLVRCRIAAPRSDVWTLVSDTSRLNRQLGIPAAQFREEEGRRRGRSDYFRSTFEWWEPPWEWLRERALVCTKQYVGGRIEQLRAILLLEEPEPGTTELWAYYGWKANGWLGRTLAARLNAYMQRGYTALLPRLQRHLEQGSIAESPLVRRAGPLEPAVHGALAEAGLQLEKAGFAPDLVQRLLRHLDASDPADLARLRTRVLARQWRVDPQALLELALQATRLGLLTLSWDVVCPHCRGVRLESPGLRQVQAEASCAACDVVFSTRAEGRVELSFRVHPRLRRIEPRVYCAADAGTKPHVVFQLELEPLERRRVDLRLEAGDYLLRRRSLADRLLLRAGPDGAAELHFPGPAQESSAVGSRLQLHLHNDLAARSFFVLEALRVENESTSVGEVLGLGRYRDLFTGDSLAAGVRVDIGEQTILFTDVVGSTRLYREAGDDKAFLLVLQHFEAVFGIVEEFRGAVVKTVGDSVMAAFADPAHGLEAALRIQEVLPQLSPLPLRISLHRGPCLAVNLNTGLDYFGSVVNEAAKLQRLAGAGDVALSQSIADAPRLQPLLASRTVRRESFRAAPGVPPQLAAILPAAVQRGSAADLQYELPGEASQSTNQSITPLKKE